MLLRRLNDRDRNDLLEIVSDSDSLHYLDWRTMNGEDVEEWLLEDTRSRLVNPGYDAYFGAELVQSSKLIAVISFNYYNEEYRHAGFNIVVNRAYRCHGYGAETVRSVLNFAFEEMNLHRVVATCDSRNVAGLKVLEKAGMRREGQCIESRKLSDETFPTELMGIIRGNSVREICKNFHHA
jgi:RimJ/RimL family protein N-acetyltransferase